MARTVEAHVRIAAPSRDVIRAFTDAAALRGWWGVHSALVTPRAGSPWVCSWDVPVDGLGFVVLSGAVKAIEPDGLLELGHLLYLNRHREVLGPMRLRVTARAEGAGSSVGVQQGGYGRGPDWDWYYELVRDNWPPALERLKGWLEGKLDLPAPALDRRV